MPLTHQNHLTTLLQRLSRLLRQSEYETGLNPAQWEALCYLAQCNKFSNNPSALTNYLGSTKGTISQTLNALERKALISKQKQSQDPRKISISLTKTGKDLLDKHQFHQRIFDPLNKFSKQQQAIFEEIIESILKTELTRRHNTTFGMCKSCIHFSFNHDKNNEFSPHLCKLLNVALSDKNKEEICAEHSETL